MSTPEGMTRRQALRRTAGLLGGVISMPVWSGVLSGCTAGSGDDWSPVILSPEQNEMVALVAERIIPTTDTPGAKAANVNRFIDKMVGESFLPEDRDRFMEGLTAFNQRCQDMYDAAFVDTTEEQQVALIAEVDDETFGDDAPPPDRENPSFYRMMKELVIVGYYTSEIGASQELKINIVPGYYDGDVPYQDIGRAWAA
jgi:hypothetical protein